MRLIDADALLEDLKKTGRYFQAKFDIENAPTVEERPQGEWINTPVTFGTCILQGYKCNCGRVVMQRENFCPDCGAKMKGGKEK